MAHRREAEVWRNKDGRSWRIGGDPKVAWIQENTTGSLGITSAIAPVSAAYATVQLCVTPTGGGWVWDERPDRHDAAVLADRGGVLSRRAAGGELGRFRRSSRSATPCPRSRSISRGHDAAGAHRDLTNGCRFVAWKKSRYD